MLRRLIELLRPFRGRLVRTAALWTLAALLPLIPPRLIGWAFEPAADVAALALGLLAAELCVMAATALKDFGARRVSEEVVAAVRSRLYRHVQRLGPDIVAERGAGTLAARIHDGTRQLDELFSAGVASMLIGPLSLAGAGAVLLWIDPMLTLLALLPLPLMALALARFSMRMRGVRRAVREADERLQQETLDGLGSVSTSWIFDRGDADAERFEARSRDLLGLKLFIARLSSTYFPLSAFLVSAGTVLVIGAGFDRGLSAGELVAFIAYLSYFYRPALALTRAQQIVVNVRAVLEQIFEMLDRAPAVAEGSRALPEGPLSLELDRVTFAYPGRPPVLRGFSMRVDPGECVGVRGPTGSGKSTLASLMVRLRDPDAGAVRIGSVDVRTLSRASLSAVVALVEQEPWIFRDTVRANVAYARPEATEAELQAAAAAADALEFIEALPDRWATRLGDGGAGLSAGQRRRLAIARARLAGPRILILDEATAPLDPEAEARVLDRVRARVNVLIVLSHRPSALARCDRGVEL